MLCWVENTPGLQVLLSQQQSSFGKHPAEPGASVLVSECLETLQFPLFSSSSGVLNTLLEVQSDPSPSQPPTAPAPH